MANRYLIQMIIRLVAGEATQQIHLRDQIMQNARIMVDTIVESRGNRDGWRRDRLLETDLMRRIIEACFEEVETEPEKASESSNSSD